MRDTRWGEWEKHEDLWKKTFGRTYAFDEEAAVIDDTQDRVSERSTKTFGRTYAFDQEAAVVDERHKMGWVREAWRPLEEDLWKNLRIWWRSSSYRWHIRWGEWEKHEDLWKNLCIWSRSSSCRWETQDGVSERSMKTFGRRPLEELTHLMKKQQL